MIFIQNRQRDDRFDKNRVVSETSTGITQSTTTPFYSSGQHMSCNVFLETTLRYSLSKQLNKYVFKSSAGRLFHIDGPQTMKLLFP